MATSTSALGDSIVDDVGGAVLGAALGFAGRAIGRRMKKAFEEKVVPAMEAKAAQAQQQWEQSKAEQDAIVARYPELRGCTKDQVVFLDGGAGPSRSARSRCPSPWHRPTPSWRASANRVAGPSQADTGNMADATGVTWGD